ncbi:hypothetical protein BOX15_Mlig028384g2 [Macrostomum lignano]|uniref:Uncharacterized protein n=1 Tax=Macrostomum lignano TaxID=282301 RepID=A0A267ESB9_9PLAT|nr:hypothetical protein BOX15_Mlig028384g1 [Macrostomum lignano]PAA84746.1 hypothetical protein BOX15_Mlig028384g3 [Macrostomum lignano]PAA87746.1 hypothetical protein BOX15_Mlig028384g2 [Macrostomum lignano]
MSPSSFKLVSSLLFLGLLCVSVSKVTAKCSSKIYTADDCPEFSNEGAEYLAYMCKIWRYRCLRRGKYVLDASCSDCVQSAYTACDRGQAPDSSRFEYCW